MLALDFHSLYSNLGTTQSSPSVEWRVVAKAASSKIQ